MNDASDNSINPIRPSEVLSAKISRIPKESIAAFNDAIVSNWDGTRATIRQTDICEEVAARIGVSRKAVFDNHWLDVEGIFRIAGRDVRYDKPGFNEGYEATFTFTKK
jgi:hypothetical protein